MHDHVQQQPLRVGHKVALASLHLPRHTPPALAAALCGLHAPGVDDRRRGIGSWPSPSRDITTRWWRILSQTPAARNARK